MNVIPEIEIPGHASAMLAAYPEHGCRRIVYTHDGQHIEEKPYTYAVGVLAGVFPNLICAGKDSAVRFLKDILDEVCELFPGPYVHIGGDEAIKQHWRRCPECQKRIREQGLKDEKELQKWLVMEMGSYLHERERKRLYGMSPSTAAFFRATSSSSTGSETMPIRKPSWPQAAK